MAGTNVGSLFVEIGAKIDGLKSGLKEADHLMNKTATTAKNMGTGVESGMGKMSRAVNVVGLIAKSLITAKAIDMVADAMIGMVNSAREWGNTIDTMGDQFGMTGEVASKWAVAMGHVGLSVNEGAMQLNYFTRQLEEASAAAGDGDGEVTDFALALSRLGVSTRDSTGRMREFDEVMPDIMDAFRELPAGIDASAIAMDLFGARGGSKFLDFLRQGSDGLDQASEKARQFGLSMDTATSDKIEQFNYRLNDLGMRMEGMKDSVGIGLIEPLTGALDLVDQLALGLGGMTAQPYELKFTVTGLESIGVMPMSTSPGASTVGPLTLDITKTLDQNRQTWGLPVTTQETPWGDPFARWTKLDPTKDPDLKSRAKYEDEVRRYRGIIQGISRSSASASAFGGGGGGGASYGGAAASLGFNDYLAAAFPDVGSAMGWQANFAAQHGGRAATQVDLRDKLAGDLFAQKYGRGATDQEWIDRYNTGSFEGMEGEEAGLDKIFGPNGTLTAKMEEKNKADADNWNKLLEAFSKAKDPTYSVQIVGRRITD